MLKTFNLAKNTLQEVVPFVDYLPYKNSSKQIFLLLRNNFNVRFLQTSLVNIFRECMITFLCKVQTRAKQTSRKFPIRESRSEICRVCIRDGAHLYLHVEFIYKGKVVNLNKIIIYKCLRVQSSLIVFFLKLYSNQLLTI